MLDGENYYMAMSELPEIRRRIIDAGKNSIHPAGSRSQRDGPP